jgi:hypothetical protein
MIVQNMYWDKIKTTLILNILISVYIELLCSWPISIPLSLNSEPRNVTRNCNRLLLMTGAWCRTHEFN